MPIISVIIPAFNAEKTIEETVKSVLNQTFSDFELIVINDGSTDRTLDIINNIKDARIKTFSYPNSGCVAASRNRGFTHAVGEFIAFLDADDLWKPEKLEAQLAALQANPQAAVAYSWVDRIDENNQFLAKGSRVNINGNVYAEILVSNFLDNGSNPLIRREAFQAVKGFDETLLHAEDQDLYIKLAARYDFVVVPHPHILYRVSANSKSANVVRMEGHILKVIEQAFQQAPASLQHLKKESISRLYRHLTVRALDGLSGRQRGLKAATFFWKSVVNDPHLFQELKFKRRLFKKVLLANFLPAQK
ncbi:glycosyltransferase [Chroococcidiopsis sp. TS-821]|uniref:glycosyltransferase n=1 Tax=Chroococcidiopsis sp. TS-821 TaxID=1378066 RepID=UPI000CEE64D1|nr:glycosyltransferase [Chroococcidiopsis sp. TS-821]PPS40645.1 glycosyl transferase family A [Chroococcidiopsis sp. TS-821]